MISSTNTNIDSVEFSEVTDNLDTQTNVLKVATLCSGIGTTEIALKNLNLNYTNEYMCEIDKNCRATYTANHNVKTIIEDMTAIEPSEFPEVDLLVASCPCQAFSIAGERKGLADERGNLSLIAFEIIEATQPEKYIFENVKGLVNHDMPYKLDLESQLSEEEFKELPKNKKSKYKKVLLEEGHWVYFKKVKKGVEIDGKWYSKGYPSLFNKEYDGIKRGIGRTLHIMEKRMADLNYTITWDVLNSKNYNTPQNRERIFIVGIRNDLSDSKTFQFPEPKPVSVSVRDVVNEVRDDVNFTNYKVNLDGKTLVPHTSVREVDIKKIYTIPEVKYESDRRIHSMNGISPCLLAGGMRHKYYDEELDIYRYLTPKEVAAVQGIPKDFKFPVSDSVIYKQVGNSISVKVMEKILSNLVSQEYFNDNSIDNEPVNNTQYLPCEDTDSAANQINTNKSFKNAKFYQLLEEEIYAFESGDTSSLKMSNTSESDKQHPSHDTKESVDVVYSDDNRCASLLKTLKKVDGVETEVITKGVNTIRAKITDKTTQILVDNIKRPLISKTMYVNQSLINYFKDRDLLENIESMNDEDLTRFLKDRKLEIVNYDSFSDDSDTKSFVPFPYAGGKQGVNKTSMQRLVKDAFKGNSYKTWVDPFAGAFGATYNVLPILLENGVEEILVNDINKSIINTYRQIQKNHKTVQRHLASISLEYYKEFGMFQPENWKKEEKGSEDWSTKRTLVRDLHNKLESEFKELEVNKKMNARRAALFLYLMSQSTGGMVDYDMDTKTCDFKKSYKVVNVELLINKVELYHKVFNSVRTTFRSVKYQTLLKKYSKDTNALVLIDPPYLEYSEEVESEKGCSHTYGIEFNHRELLEKMKNSEFDYIYYNNHNPLLENYATKHGLEYIKNSRDYTNGTSSSQAVEITMVKFNKKEVNLDSNSINTSDINSVENNNDYAYAA